MKSLRIHIVLVLSILILASCTSGKASEQSLVGKEDARILKEIINRSVRCQWAENTQIDSLAAFFIGTPYTGGSLESESGEEQLVVNLRTFDCMTFVENVLALHRMLKKYDPEHFPADSCIRIYPELLEQIRYRHGERQDYTSRLHYTTEWLYDNQQKGNIRLMTDMYSKQLFPLDVHYMSAHPEKYTALCLHPEYVPKMAAIEAQINKKSLIYLPKERLAGCVEDIPEGCIVAITTTADGLDIGHLGFAVWKGSQLYLLHASSSAGQVVYSDKNLIDYLLSIKRFSGIVIAIIL